MTERRKIVVPVPSYPEKLVALSRLTPENESKQMRNNWELVVDFLEWWEKAQINLRKFEDREEKLEILEGLLERELKEVEENRVLEEELKRVPLTSGIEWYEDELALKRWKVVSEMADVMVLVFAVLYSLGYKKEEIKYIFESKWQHKSSCLIKELKERASEVGIDLAEAIIYKTEINIQHRDPSLWSEWRNNGFMKRMRHEVGDESSQMPHLGQGPLGVTVLTRLQSGDFDNGWGKEVSGFPLIMQSEGYFLSLHMILRRIGGLRVDYRYWGQLRNIEGLFGQGKALEIIVETLFRRGDRARLTLLLSMLGFNDVKIMPNPLHGIISDNENEKVPWRSLNSI